MQMKSESSIRELAEAMLRALAEELDALLEHDAERLARCQQRKSKLARALGRQRPSGPGLESRERRLLELCKARNLRNGVVLGIRRRHVVRTIEILYGLPEASQTYGPSGRPLEVNRSPRRAQA